MAHDDGAEPEDDAQGDPAEPPSEPAATDGAPRIRTGRIGRTAGVGTLVAGQGVRWAGTRVANLTRSEEARQQKTDERVAAIATQLARQLGQMKGAAMKIGQVLSTIELPGLSEEGQEEFRAALAELRDNAPKFDYADIETVITEDLGGSVADHFAEFEREAFAAASIGQVHRARTHEGDEVAVKVQYPGVAEAVEIDLRNLHLILRLVKRMAPGLDAKAVGGEIRERITEELDYELEAQNHRAIQRAYRGHPFVVVPRVHTGLSSRRVLTTTYLDGRRFEDVAGLEEAERDRFGEIVFRFFLSTRNRTGMVLGDPHPGNYLRLTDGSVGFLDFGLLRRVPPEHLELERSLARAIGENRAEDVHALMSTLGYLPEPEDFDPEALLDQVRTGAAWLFEPGFRRLDPAYAHELLEQGGSPRSPHYEAMKRQTMPPASLLMRRQEALILVVLAQLRAGADWQAIAAEYAFDGEPSTELGGQEAEFWGGSG
ncbi:MAG TPA: AarF/ABC1/UbiB kinase family protein [Solirubrobacterales bacterium]|nr:AarF/ABC1/UbiB kinase family protein [Solirubrobacterales bacterium]